jgi:arylsulfatase A
VNITDWIPGNADRDKPLVPPQDRDDLAPEETTLAEALRAQGYSTFHVGKWHLGGAGRLPEDQGFDVNVMGGRIGHPASYFFPYGAATATRPAHSHAVPALPPGGAPGDDLTARQAAEAVRLIAGAATADKPFLLYLPFYSVHAPLEAPAETVEKYRRKKATAEGAAAAGAMRPVHAAMVEETDRAVGRVLDALDAAGVAENTLVVFTSDNGGVGGATDLAPLRGSKRTLYEGGVRVPLVVRYPGVARAGARTNVVAITQDLFATACAAAGAETSPEVRTDARDLTPALRGDGDLAERDAVFWHFPHYLNDGGPPSGAVRSGRWKLIEPYGGGPAQLFDLSADPGESHDLAAERPEVAADLRARHAAWRASVGARMPTRRGG